MGIKEKKGSHLVEEGTEDVWSLEPWRQTLKAWQRLGGEAAALQCRYADAQRRRNGAEGKSMHQLRLESRAGVALGDRRNYRYFPWKT